jgi:hypothetical protein
MLTVRYIEKLWDAREYKRLVAELLAPRIESAAAEELRESPSAAAAALSLIRLDELHQVHVPLCSRLIRSLVALQQADGGWGDVAVTALCIRALSLQNGGGLAIQRGIAYLASLQQPGGIWPKIPFRRMPADALVSAFVLLQLADHCDFPSGFSGAIDFDAAFGWFESHRWTLDPAAKALWDHARLRVPAPLTTRATAPASWS